jgi:hypothetical protein
MATKGTFLGVKRPWREASVEAKKTWIYTTIPRTYSWRSAQLSTGTTLPCFFMMAVYSRPLTLTRLRSLVHLIMNYAFGAQLLIYKGRSHRAVSVVFQTALEETNATHGSSRFTQQS